MSTDLTDAAVYNSLRLDLLKRVALWAAAGNAGGLIAAAVPFNANMSTKLAYVLFPSLWAFAIGLVAAGLLNLLFLIEVDHQFRAETDPRVRAKQKADLLDFVFIAVMVVAPLAFLVGVFYPLIAFSVRYFTGVGFDG